VRALLPAALLVLALATPTAAHDVERAEALLGEIGAERRATVEAPAESARVEAFFRLGVAVDTLVEAVNRDVATHGRDLYTELLAERLRAHGLGVAWAAEQNRYAYDQAAFREYLRRAPRGQRAAEASFRLLSGRFYATLGTNPAALVGTDVAGVLKAVAEEERFLADHPTHERAETVRFFLAVDHYRIARNTSDPVRRQTHARRARRALQQTVERSGEAFEVRAAQALLDALGVDGAGRE
jgi:hypothetical protein